MFINLLRTILIIVIVYYLFRLFFRYVFPLVLRYFIKRTVEKDREQRRTGRRDEDLSIKYRPKKQNFPEDLGEVVDYEEIKEDEVNPDHKENKK